MTRADSSRRRTRNAPALASQGRSNRTANPLRVSSGFRSFVLDQLERSGPVISRSMFGGVGLYAEGVFFGILAGDTLYLRVDDTTRDDFEAAGMHPFKPYAHRSGTMQYFSVPVSVLENADELAGWVRKAVAVAGQPTMARRKSPRRPKRNAQRAPKA